MRATLLDRMNHRFRLFEELVGKVSDSDFRRSLDVPRSKTIAEHLWCVVGARQSYRRALEAGEWVGFQCSLDESADRREYLAELERSARELRGTVEAITEWTDGREALLAQLHEHETIHEGQLIRQVYALELKMPNSSFWA